MQQTVVTCQTRSRAQFVETYLQYCIGISSFVSPGISCLPDFWSCCVFPACPVAANETCQFASAPMQSGV